MLGRRMRRPYGVFPVIRPLQGIIDDVFTDAVHRFVVADDMFVIIALPDRNARGATYFIDAFGNGGFKRSNDCGDRT